MAKAYTLEFRAGETAFKKIREEGLNPAQIGTLAGASGGAKWLVLSQLDRVVATEILPRLEGPVYTIGTSIGGWRFACYAQDDPLSAIQRFEEAYLSQTYSKKPDRVEITRKSAEILKEMLGDRGVAEILAHPVLRTNIMTVRSRGPMGMESAMVLGPALFAAAAANAISRKTLGTFFQRALFYDRRDIPPFFDLDDFPPLRVPLSSDNLKDAVLATGSIPLVLQGVKNIAGAPPGIYRDGGVIDYHLDFPHAVPGRICLYLHFINRVIPGWFDKALKNRTAAAANIQNTLLICPSQEFVQTLPHGKIPDRRDFKSFDPITREKQWRTVVAQCAAMAEELNDVLQTGTLGDRLQPL